MANMTVADAITATYQLLDEVVTGGEGRRWSSAQVTASMSVALSKCINAYQSAGGDRFDLESTQTTSATDGSVDISSLVPMAIKDVGVITGSVTYRIPAKQKMRRGYTDATARQILILYAREYALSSTTSDPLVGVGAVAANSWPAFDDWVVAQTALDLALKDLEGQRLQWITQRAADSKANVIDRVRIPGGYPWPRREWAPFFDWLAWQWKPSTNKLNTVRVAW